MQAYLDETDFYKMVIVLNTELTMGTGKVSAQVAHAAIGKFTFLPPSNEVCEVYVFTGLSVHRGRAW